MQTNPRKKHDKKNKYLYIAISLILVLLIILLAMLIKFPEKETNTDNSSSTPSYKTLYDFSNNTAKSIKVSLNNGVNYELYADSNKLYTSNNVQVDDHLASLMFNFVNAICVEDTLYGANEYNGEQDSQLGLSPPVVKLDIVYQNNKSISLLSGDKIPLSSFVYFKNSLDKGLYAITQGFEDLFYVNPDTLYKKIRVEVDRNNIKSIHISKVMEDDFTINISDIQNERVYATVYKAFEYPANPVQLNKIIGTICNIVPGAYVEDFDISKQSKYGFDSNMKITITPFKGDVVNIAFGNEAGDYAVYMLYENKVYRISTILLSPLLNSEFNKLLSNEAFTLSINEVSNIKSIEDEYKGIKNIWEIRKDNKDELSISKNGKNFDVQAFKDLIKNMITKSTELKTGALQNKLVLSRKINISFYDRPNYTVEFYSINEYLDNIYVNGNCVYSWTKEGTDSIIKFN